MSIDPELLKIGLLGESITINSIQGLPYARSHLLSQSRLTLKKQYLLNFLCFYSLKHEAFMLGTSKTKPDGGGFDLFITTAPIPDLNEKINVFGRVIKGEDVVQVNDQCLLSYIFLFLLTRMY